MTLPRVRVAPEDAERAAAVLANPIPDSFRREYAEMSYDNASFADQWCPPLQLNRHSASAGESPHLNDWLCSNCGYDWQDPLPDNLREKP